MQLVVHRRARLVPRAVVVDDVRHDDVRSQPIGEIREEVVGRVHPEHDGPILADPLALEHRPDVVDVLRPRRQLHRLASPGRRRTGTCGCGPRRGPPGGSCGATSAARRAGSGRRSRCRAARCAADLRRSSDGRSARSWRTGPSVRGTSGTCPGAGRRCRCRSASRTPRGRRSTPAGMRRREAPCPSRRPRAGANRSRGHRARSRSRPRRRRRRIVEVSLDRGCHDRSNSGVAVRLEEDLSRPLGPIGRARRDWRRNLAAVRRAACRRRRPRRRPCRSAAASGGTGVTRHGHAHRHCVGDLGRHLVPRHGVIRRLQRDGQVRRRPARSEARRTRGTAPAESTARARRSAGGARRAHGSRTHRRARARRPVASTASSNSRMPLWTRGVPPNRIMRSVSANPSRRANCGTVEPGGIEHRLVACMRNDRRRRSDASSSTFDTVSASHSGQNRLACTSPEPSVGQSEIGVGVALTQLVRVETSRSP